MSTFASDRSRHERLRVIKVLQQSPIRNRRRVGKAQMQLLPYFSGYLLRTLGFDHYAVLFHDLVKARSKLTIVRVEMVIASGIGVNVRVSSIDRRRDEGEDRCVTKVCVLPLGPRAPVVETD